MFPTHSFKSLLQGLTIALGLLVAVVASAEDVPAPVRDAIQASLAKVLPEMPHQEISATPFEGVFKVTLPGGRFLYFSGDGRHMISGELYQIDDDGLVNLAEDERKVERKAKISQLDPKNLIVFPAEGTTKAIINVFTDVDCPYCVKLHREVPELNSKGVEVRYLAFPRAGLRSMSYVKIASAWCADDPRQALTDVKNGKKIDSEVCEDNPVASQYALGEELGVQGTPALVLMDGTLIPGYQPAAQLLEALGIQ